MKPGKPARPVVDRLLEKCDRSGDCWIWTGTIDVQGYGRIGMPGEGMLLAHRVAYVLFVGPIPGGLHLDHTCHNADKACLGGPTCPHRHCVNPAHLEPVTNAENARRGRGGIHMTLKTHCPQGHEYTPENTKVIPSRPNARYCKACHRERGAADARRARARAKEKAAA